MDDAAGLLLVLAGEAAGDAVRRLRDAAGLSGVIGTAVAGARPPRWLAAGIFRGGEGLPRRLGFAADILRAMPVTPRLTTPDDAPGLDRVWCVVLSNPAPGREDEFNAWYTDRHLRDVLDVPGYLAAQRFRTVQADGAAPAWAYAALYEVDAARHADAVAEVARRTNTELMPISPTADLASLCSAHFAPAAR